MIRWLMRLVPSVRVLMLAAAVLVTVTLAAVASVVGFGSGGRIDVEPEPVVAWIAFGGVVVISIAMLAGVMAYRCSRIHR